MMFYTSFVLVPHPATAAAPSIDEAREAFSEPCGVFEVVDLDRDLSDRCAFWFDSTHAGWAVRVSGASLSEATSPPTAERLPDVGAADLAMVVDLGFEPDQIDGASTDVLAVRHTDDGREGAPHYQATLTVFDRRIDGVAILGSRIAVIRNLEGELLELLVTWPDVSGFIFVVESDPWSDAVVASETGFEVTGADSVFFPREIVDGVATVGEIVTEVYIEVSDPWGGTRPSSRLYRNGSPVEFE